MLLNELNYSIIETIFNNLYKQIIHKKYKYRKTNRTYTLTSYNIIDICFSKVLNII